MEPWTPLKVKPVTMAIRILVMVVMPTVLVLMLNVAMGRPNVERSVTTATPTHVMVATPTVPVKTQSVVMASLNAPKAVTMGILLTMQTGVLLIV
jgi:hypothetical protein